MAEQNRISWQRRLFYTTAATDRSRMRAVANNVILHLHPTRLPAGALRFTYTWGLGGISATLTLLLVVTGVLLMFRYEPSVESAYVSIKMIETQVVFGSLFRAVHHWSANLLIITVFLHLLRVFFTGGFKKGRATNWLVGIGLFLLVVAFNFTGYLLPWDQLAYWAITVGTRLLGYVPLVGDGLSRFLLGGPEVGQGALSNFYAIHVAVLPVLLVLTMSYHFWKVRKDGGISRPERASGTSIPHVTTIPHLVRREFAAALVVIAGIVLWAMFVPAPLEELANPMQSPNPAKAAWYFVGLQELLLHMHPLAAMILLALVVAGIALLPRWDRAEGTIGLYFRSPAGRRAALLGTLLGADLVPLMVIADEFWLDLPGLFPNWPVFIATGLVPLLSILILLGLVYAGVRLGFKTDHGEALVGTFTFLMAGLVALTVIGVYFRGQNMALIWPF